MMKKLFVVILAVALLLCAAALAEELRRRGVDLPDSIYTPQYLVKVLLKKRGGALC